ncbi:aminotransferase class V-fold PLP-dependent enzyme [Sulfurimonas sp.]|uniref:aminotransferase class V-fold PLP-dependent enzyme n=1 Tax=Sulfurimonas sp. TaxID=2022749 RepID=UPI0025F80DF8|nr:aminotransferase class V-fold PLP-dependent enzyme [Sulfurimonas sp.]MCK9472539.1 aminotransferase class V-fold PLP-dependent enzyme [Sulfurimonas sp.]MDD3505916.1 aminotransferase class V-fold PLP-dependent enzyme [Sulfurimonas sp.]
MSKELFRPLLLESKKNSKEEIRKSIIGIHKRHYFDYTASGLAYKAVESRIAEVLKTYANTHSREASMAAKTDFLYKQARRQLKSLLKLELDFAILPAGCGATAAIKKFQEILGIYIPPATRKRFKIQSQSSSRPLVIVGPYEHHSNEVSYREALCDTVRIGINSEGMIDLEQLEDVLKTSKHTEKIGAFCIASNVTGIITPYEKISKLLRKYGAIVCFDAAASSPYMNVPSSFYDVMFLSPHKLIGGPGSCGLLVIRKALIDESIAPTFAGGGTVEYVDRNNHLFIDEKEAREDAGTSPILQLIRAALAYQLRNEIGFTWIKKEKNELMKYLIKGLLEIPGCTIYGSLNEENIGIVSFNIEKVDPYQLCSYMSSKNGLQTRAGCSCAGPYGHDLLGLDDNHNLDEKPGWLRISIHFSQEISDIDYLLCALNKSICEIKN